MVTGGSTNMNWKRKLHVAVTNNYEDFMTCLNTMEVQRELPTVRNWNINESPLHEAASKGHLRCIEALVENEININSYAICGLKKQTALDLAILKSKNVRIISYLLEKGADPNLKSFNRPYHNGKLILQCRHGRVSSLYRVYPGIWLKYPVEQLELNK